LAAVGGRRLTIVDNDDELLQYVKVAVARDHGLSDGQARRLTGQSLREIEADARRMRRELGLDPLDEPQPRDRQGRYRGSEHAAINNALRAASGR
jgi:hypothetical protein